MALSFSSINRALTDVQNVSSSVRSITAPTNSSVANIGRFASQIGTFDKLAGQTITNLSNLGSTLVDTGNVVGQIAGISGLGNKAADFLLGAADTAIGTVASLTGNTTINSLRDLVGELPEEFTENIIKVLPRDAAQLAGAVGGDFDILRQRVERIGDISNLDDFVNLSFKSPWDTDTIGAGLSNVTQNSGVSKSRIPNPLRKHNSYNYIITLGVLDPNSFNFPESYRSNGGFTSYILKSGGGNYSERYQVFDEVGSGTSEHAEYFIDNLEMDAVIAPNPNTGVATGTTISFTVTEPYSMGNFVEAIIGAAAEAGYSNYTQAPFALKFDFVGWNEGGQADANFIGQPSYVPILISKVEFSVTGQGSTYQVTAVPYSEIALGDEANTSNADINAVGTVVHDILNGPDRSITATLNQRIENLENEGVTSQGDRYIIAFPKDLNGFKSAIQGLSPGTESIQTAAQQTQRERGLATTPDQNAEKQENLEQVVVPASSQLFQILDSYAKDESKMNAIGLSLVVEDTAEGGDQSQPDPNTTYNEDGDVINRGTVEAGPSEKAREHKFQSGETITQIIEKVLLRSQYAADQATTESNTNGTREWFKIDTQVYVDPDTSTQAIRGRPALVYVYSVIPYFPDEAKFLGTREAPQNTQGLMASAAKEYNYIYTGLNEDVLNFELNFNNAFMQTAFSNLGQNSGGANSLADRAHVSGADNVTGTQMSTNSGDSATRESGAGLREAPDLDVVDSGSRSSDLKLRIARQFHNRITTQTVDMVTCEMEILGDPFFIPQQTGNFTGNPVRGAPNVIEEGTMNYMQNEVFIVVNFKTPFDYQIEGATMEFPQTVPQFSGLFSVWAVTNSFSGGQFKQTLKLIRRRGQDNEPTTGNQGPVVPNNSASINDNQEPAPLAGADTTAQARTRANSTIGAGDPCSNEVTTVEQPEWAPTADMTAEDALMSQPILPTQTTTGGGDVVFNQGAVRVGNVTFDPNTSIFPAAPQVNKAPEQTIQEVTQQVEAAASNSVSTISGLINAAPSLQSAAKEIVQGAASAAETSRLYSIEELKHFSQLPEMKAFERSLDSVRDGINGGGPVGTDRGPLTINITYPRSDNK